MLLSVVAVLLILKYALSESAYTLFVYYINPLVWLGLSIIVYTRERVRFTSKLRERPFLFTWVILIAVLYDITFFASGMVWGMGKSPFPLDVRFLMPNLFALFLPALLMEWVRNYLINGAAGRKRTTYIVLVTFLFAFHNLRVQDIPMDSSWESWVMFFGSKVLPSLMLSAFLSYIVYLGGAFTGVLYQALTLLPIYLLPVLPDLNWLIRGILGTVFPMFSLYVLRDVYLKRTKQIKTREDKKENPFGWIAVLAASMLLVWFIAGLFPVYPVTIMSGSMEPLMHAGDVAMIRRENAEQIKVGDIVQYWNQQVFILHRVVATDYIKGETVYITKGDNNSVRDTAPVGAEQIHGKVIAIIPKIGFLTYLIRAR